jgi:ribose 5-phosphate isomerase A
MDADAMKLEAARRALEFIEPGMKLGLGTGSTAAKLVDLLGAKVRQGFDVVCVPTSEATAAQARGLGIRLASIDDEPLLDLTIDGADELDDALRLIKGGGGALLREKIVATASQRMLVIADQSKRVATLGRFPLPVEVVRFGSLATSGLVRELAESVGCTGEISLRKGRDGQPFVTDGGNYILDCAFGAIEEPEVLEAILKTIPGVVETGLFIDIAWKAIIAGPQGVVVLDAPEDDFADIEE